MKAPALLVAASLIVLSAPAWAQTMDHSKMPGMQMPASPAPAPTPKQPDDRACPPDMAAMGHCTPKAPSAPPPTIDPACPPDMAAMGHCTPKIASPVPTPSAAAAKEAGEMSAMPGHDMTAMPGMAAAAGTDLPAGTAPPPRVPTDHAADAVYGPAAMGMGRHHLEAFHGGQKLFQALVNIAEVQVRNGRDSFEWDAEAWYGGDIRRLWLKSEGDGEFGRTLEKAEVRALYSHAIGPYFNLQGGLRYDFKPDPSRVYATIGVEGLVPSFFDVEAALFLSDRGELMARLEGYYDQRITQRLILQPRAELNFAAQNSPDIQVGTGLSDAEIGLRLRYDIRREFAPYVGVQYRRAFGRTRDYLKAAGKDTGGWSLLAGIRAWF